MTDSDNPTALNTAPTAGETKVVQTSGATSRPEVSASTIARMMGLATVNELALLEGKIDLLSTRITAMTAKLDRIAASVNGMPSGSDLERIDVQIGSLKSLIKEALVGIVSGAEAKSPAGTTGAAAGK